MLTRRMFGGSFRAESGTAREEESQMHETCRPEMPKSAPTSPFKRRRWLGWGCALLLAWSGPGRPCLAQPVPPPPELPGEVRCPPPNPDHKEICFNMVPSGGAAACLPNAKGRVRV